MLSDAAFESPAITEDDVHTGSLEQIASEADHLIGIDDRRISLLGTIARIQIGPALERKCRCLDPG